MIIEKTPCGSGPIDRPALIQKDFALIHAAIMQGFECKKLQENSKQVVKKVAMSFSKYVDTLEPPAIKINRQ